MPYLPPSWIFVCILLATLLVAGGSEIARRRKSAAMQILAGQYDMLHTPSADELTNLRLANAMTPAGLEVGAASVRARHLVTRGTAGHRTGVARLDYTVGSVGLRSNRSRVIRFGEGPEGLRIIEAAAPSRSPRLWHRQYQELLENVEPAE